MDKIKKRNRGFTLIELVVVIAIIGIMAAVLVPSVTAYIGKAKKSSAIQAAGNAYEEFANNYTYCEEKDINKYIDDNYPSSVKGYYHNYGNYTCLIRNGEIIKTLDRISPFYYFMKIGSDKISVDKHDEAKDNAYMSMIDMSESDKLSDDLKGYYVYVPVLNIDQCKIEIGDGIERVSYISATKGAYIDTGFKPNGNTKVEVQFDILSNTDVNWLYGARSSVKSGISDIYGLFLDDCVNGDDPYSIKYKYGDYNPLVSAYRYTYGESTTVISDKGKVYIKAENDDDFSLDISTDNKTFTTNYNMYLFTMNNGANGVDSRTVDGRIYYCKIWDNDVLVRYFIPSFDEESEAAGMYDVVNDVFYPAQGSGTFTYVKG